MGTLYGRGERWKNLRRRCAELALPGFCQDLGQGRDGEVCALQEDVLGSRAEFRLVDPNERAQKLRDFRISRSWAKSGVECTSFHWHLSGPSLCRLSHIRRAEKRVRYPPVARVSAADGGMPAVRRRSAGGAAPIYSGFNLWSFLPSSRLLDPGIRLRLCPASREDEANRGHHDNSRQWDGAKGKSDR